MADEDSRSESYLGDSDNVTDKDTAIKQSTATKQSTKSSTKGGSKSKQAEDDDESEDSDSSAGNPGWPSKQTVPKNIKVSFDPTSTRNDGGSTGTAQKSTASSQHAVETPQLPSPTLQKAICDEIHQLLTDSSQSELSIGLIPCFQNW